MGPARFSINEIMFSPLFFFFSFLCVAHVSESWRPRELFLFSFPAVFFLFDDFLPYFMVILF